MRLWRPPHDAGAPVVSTVRLEKRIQRHPQRHPSRKAHNMEFHMQAIQYRVQRSSKPWYSRPTSADGQAGLVRDMCRRETVPTTHPTVPLDELALQHSATQGPDRCA